MKNVEKKKNEGKLEKVKGKVKEKAGEVVGNDDLKRRGEAEAASGEAKKQTAKKAGQVEGKVKELAGKAEEKLGDLTGEKSTEARGKARKLEGKAEKHANR